MLPPGHSTAVAISRARMRAPTRDRAVGQALRPGPGTANVARRDEGIQLAVDRIDVWTLPGGPAPVIDIERAKEEQQERGLVSAQQPPSRMPVAQRRDRRVVHWHPLDPGPNLGCGQV